jgi:hypothetical protein
MWIVQLALRRPYTFIVLALLVLIVGVLAIRRTPVDIFPNIDIPVISVIWRYTGLSSEEMEGRIVSTFERAMTATVSNIEHIESQTTNGVGVVKVFLHPGAKVDATLAQIVAIAQTMLYTFPPSHPAAALQHSVHGSDPSSRCPARPWLSTSCGPRQQLHAHAAAMAGRGAAVSYGGKTRQVMVTRPKARRRKPALDVVRRFVHVIRPPALQDRLLEYDVALNGSPEDRRAERPADPHLPARTL